MNSSNKKTSKFESSSRGARKNNTISVNSDTYIQKHNEIETNKT